MAGGEEPGEFIELPEGEPAQGEFIELPEGKPAQATDPKPLPPMGKHPKVDAITSGRDALEQMDRGLVSRPPASSGNR